MNIFDKTKEEYDISEIKNMEKYNIDPEDNVPMEIYGIPKPIQKKVCEQNWNEKDEIIQINLADSISKFLILMQKKLNDCSFIFIQSTLEDGNGLFLENTLKMPKVEFDYYLKRLLDLSKEWSLVWDKNTGRKKVNDDLEWTLDIGVKSDKVNFSGKGEIPINGWNNFIDLVSELEIIFKTMKEKEKNRLKFENQNKDIVDFALSNSVLPNEIKKVIKKEDWKTCDMPKQHDTFILDKVLTDEDINNLKNGHEPECMEDKWFWYVELNRLYIHRSWTGFCIYIVDLNTNGHLNVIVNRNVEQYKNTDIEEDKKTLSHLLDYWKSDKYNYYDLFIDEIDNALLSQKAMNDKI